MNLHIVNDEKFINGSIDTFDVYYPGKNIFIVQKPNSENWTPKYVKPGLQVKFLSLTNKNDIKIIYNIIKQFSVTNIFIHYLTPARAAVVNTIKEDNKYIKIYWIFYGADLYSTLNSKFGYELYDYPLNKKSGFDVMPVIFSRIKFFLFYGTFPFAAYKKFIKNLNYFGFWNPYDFGLLKKYFQTNAEFKYFGYYQSLDNKLSPVISKGYPITIIVNNSSSGNGNHKTILNKIKSFDNTLFDKIIVPLSYGSENVKKDVLKHGIVLFGEKFEPLLTFMDKESYIKKIAEADVAFFGARRQEAAGNIFLLLGLGIKVFLRRDNNMTQFLKDNGFIFFIFEKDLNSSEDLIPLNENQKAVNNNAYHAFYKQEKHKEMMEDLIINT